MVARVLLGQSVDGLGQPHCRDGDPPLRDAEALGVLRGGQRRQKPVEVGQRLSHAHHDDVTEPFVGRQEQLEPEQLFQDLARGEVADHAVEAARAEHAAHRAAHLRTDADGAAVAVPQEHALDPLAVVEFQKELFGAVVGLGVLCDRRRPDPETTLQLRSQILREVGHVGKRRRSATKQPAADRFGTPGRLLPLDEPFTQQAAWTAVALENVGQARNRAGRRVFNAAGVAGIGGVDFWSHAAHHTLVKRSLGAPRDRRRSNTPQEP